MENNFEKMNRGTLPEATFSLAKSGDDTEIREFLKTVRIGKNIKISLEREPEFFLESRLGPGSQQTCLVRSQNRMVGVGRCTVRRRFFNGEPRWVAYSGELLLAPELAARYDIRRQGYLFLRELVWENQPDFYLTAVQWNDLQARAMLERDSIDLPRYRFMGNFVTLLIPVPLKTEAGFISGEKNDPKELAEWLNRNNVGYQFAPYWTPEELLSLRNLGLSMEDFVVNRDEGRIVSCAALWDQRRYKQAVIREYDWRLEKLRPLLNSLIKLNGYPGLPLRGSSLEYGFISHLGMDTEQPGLLIALMHSLFSRARSRGIEFLVTGFAEGDRRLAVIQRYFNSREYRTRLCCAPWKDGPFPLGRQFPFTEVAIT